MIQHTPDEHDHEHDDEQDEEHDYDDEHNDDYDEYVAGAGVNDTAHA